MESQGCPLVTAGWVAQGDSQPIDPLPLVKLLGSGRSTMAEGVKAEAPSPPAELLGTLAPHYTN